MKLKILSINLRVPDLRDGLDAWPFRIGRAAEAILRSGADLIGVQEDKPGMLARLSARLPEFAVLAEGTAGRGEACTILYRRDRLRLWESGVFRLSETPGVPGSRSWGSAESRLCRWGIFGNSPGSEARFKVYNTHLDHKSAHARECGSRLIADRIRDDRLRTGSPAILMGDLNAKPDDPELAALVGTSDSPSAGLLIDVLTGEDRAIGTFHGFRGECHATPVRIDYIFVTPDVRVMSSCVDKEKVRGRYPSDHYPVIAEILF